MPKETEQSKLALTLSLGGIITGNLLGGLLLGYLVDRWLSTPPWFLLVGMLIGLANALRHVLRVATRL